MATDDPHHFCPFHRFNSLNHLAVTLILWIIQAIECVSPSLQGYAVVIHELKQLVGGQKSATRITGTEPLQKAFHSAKSLAEHPIGITDPNLMISCIHS